MLCSTVHVPAHGSATGALQPLESGPRLWNSLPARIRQPDNDIGEFRQQLKSFFCSSDIAAHSDCLFLCAS